MICAWIDTSSADTGSSQTTSLGLSEPIIRTVVVVVGLMFIYTMVANIASWSFGVNSVAKYAADDGSMPKVFSKENKQGVAYMASIMNGIVASIIVVLGIVLGVVSETASNLFWMFFSFSLVTLLLSYVPLFPAFLKLRKSDNTERAYKVPGGKVVLNLVTWIPFVLLILGIVFTMFGDFSKDYIMEGLPLIIGVVVSLIVQEILVARVKK